MKVNLRQELSPIKFCFFIKPNRKDLLESIKCLFSVWCGIYSPIIPYYKRFSEKYRLRYNMGASRKVYYGNIIKNYDPDIIVYDDDIDKEELIAFGVEVKMISLSKFKEDLERFSLEKGISIDLVINSLIKEEFKYNRTDNLKIRIPEINKDDLLLNAWQGTFLNSINIKYVQNYLLKESFIEKIDFNYKTFNKFFENNNLSLRFINIYKTRLLYDRGISKNTVLYFLNPSDTLDVIDYWNLRALGWKLFPVPVSKMKTVPYKEAIIEILKDLEIREKRFKFKIIDVLISSSFKPKPIMDYVNSIISDEKLKVSLLHQHWFPRFWHDYNEILRGDLVFCPQIFVDSEHDTIESEEAGYVNFKLPPLPFKSRFSNSGLLKSNLSLSYWEDEGKYAEVISGITTKDWVGITRDFSFRNEWKVSKNGIFKYINHEDDNVSFYLPESFKFFSKYFVNKDISIKQTASGKLGYEVLKNIGGIHGANLFSTSNAIKIVELFENGNVVSVEELVGKINQHKPYPEFKKPKDVIELLLRKQIIEFGVKIQCSVCEQRTFYLLQDLNDELKCSVCRNTFELPKSDPKSSLKYVYRGLGPFSRNNKVDGLLSVFLTIRLFKLDMSDGTEGISFIFDFEAKKDKNDFEVDLVVLSKSFKYENKVESFVCECKTFKSIGEKDYFRLKFFGEQMEGTTLVVATLKEEFLEDEKVLLRKLVNDFRTKEFDTTNPVLLLTGSELIPNRGGFGLSEYSDTIKNYTGVDYVKTIADLSCEKHLGLRTCSELQNEAWMKKHQKKKGIE
ncbi:hypothetical protein Q4Q39_17435 [Flavivirga amylovorans]|uniref:Uncharacterized protein n=1 Tax=Flavivirga amylovorans TaxID=870486 RepID=A0ABT8X5D7_9FLAO|nr:hypothetical protein [Flavivirga amylovorans]MDO5989190.1 hypothetical protein [Flavivirga amylovorans]